MSNAIDVDEKVNLFLQVWLKPIKDGVLGVLGAKNLQTLIALSHFMNDKGKCYPSESLLASLLGLKEISTISKRIRSLEKVIWGGKPILLVSRSRRKKDKSGIYRWENNRYELNTEIISIFAPWQDEQAGEYTYDMAQKRFLDSRTCEAESKQDNYIQNPNYNNLTIRPPIGGGEKVSDKKEESSVGIEKVRRKLQSLKLKGSS